VRADVILLDLRDLRPSVAYRLVARIRSGGWNGCLVIAVGEHELGLIPTAKRFGASDFVLPSMSPAELAVRLFAVDAQAGAVSLDASESTKGDVALEWRTHELVSGSMRAQLTLRELQLLEVLLARKGMTTTTAELAQLAWGKTSKAGRTLAATYVCSLRKKLAWFGGRFGVRTIRGVGYRFELVAR
jgi:DNA-binding response OmpR family regulator